MSKPVYVVTGFLEAGKTTFLNNLLSSRDWARARQLVIQFEIGEEAFVSHTSDCQVMKVIKKELEQVPDQVVSQLEAWIRQSDPQEIWIEWNGVVPFSELQALLLQPALRALCRLQKVIHVADGDVIETLLGRTGAALPEQIANSDFVLLRNTEDTADFKRIRRVLNEVNPGAGVYPITAYADLSAQLSRRKTNSVDLFFLLILVVVGLIMVAAPLFDLVNIPFTLVVNVFLGVILQAIPFLLIGVLLSSAIQIFVSRDFIERRFPKSYGLGMVTAIFAGFFLPVCDCASIPIFRSLVKKGVPLPVAVTFMTATPVINPVVILSTWYAFNGNMGIVFGRVALGIIAAILIGLLFIIFPSREEMRSDNGLDSVLCSCGCYTELAPESTFKEKAALFLRHAQSEFFNVGKFLVIGTFISAIFQTIGTDMFVSVQSGAGMAVSILIMMVMAFVLSLCSSSDAVVARVFAGQFPMSALMGFLVFGPMMDIKNMMMLSSGFSKRFIAKLTIITFLVCFAVVFLFTV